MVWLRFFVVGVDPGVRGRSTGVALVEYGASSSIVWGLYTVSLYEALFLVNSVRPWVLVVDSPLSLPAGAQPWRSVDLLARRLGLRVLPPGWRGMRRLVEGVLGFLSGVEGDPLVLETHPSSVLRVTGCGFEKLVERLGCRLVADPSTSHERDAVIAACVGVAFLRGLWARIEARDGSIWLVDPIVCRYPPTPDSSDGFADKPGGVA